MAHWVYQGGNQWVNLGSESSNAVEMLFRSYRAGYIMHQREYAYVDPTNDDGFGPYIRFSNNVVARIARTGC